MNNLSKFREINKIKQKDLALYLKVSPVFLSQIENGKRKMPEDILHQLIDNNCGWDTSMLTDDGVAVSMRDNSGVIMGSHNSHNNIDNRHYYSDSPDVLKAQIDLLDERIKEKDAQIKEKDAQIKEKDAQIKEKDAQIRQLLEILKTK